MARSGRKSRLSPLGPEGFQGATDVSRETLARLRSYGALLETWNRAINLVGPATMSDMWRRHMLDSAQFLPHLPPPPVGRPRVLVDLGSGGGFPGLVLAILGAGEVHLVEANGKKAVFLRQVARQTGTRVVVHGRRIERLVPFPADVVTARALAPLPQLLTYAAPFLRRADGQGRGVALFAKGRGVDGELTDSAERWMMGVEAFPSRTDREGKILRIRRLAEKGRPS